MIPSQIDDLTLADEVAQFYADPLGFVLWAYDWGYGDLAGFDGPDEWQREYLLELGREVSKRGFDGVTPVDPIRMATASGHGIGKSALVAWLVDWIMSTRPHCKGTVTANTSAQLESKTWAEIAKWTKRCLTGHWFNISSGKGAMKMVHRDHPETWRCKAETCREENSEAFAGQHAANSTSFYIKDEGSAVPDKIWEVAEGGLTDGEPMWFVFGNPTRNTGRFRECFGRFRHRWITRQIDSRTVRITNKSQIKQWIDDYGEDSDFVRVRVRGVFPRAGSMQFIDGETVAAARQRRPDSWFDDPRVMGVDVARFGDDQTVIVTRCGRDAQTIPWTALRGADTMTVAAKIAEIAEDVRPDVIFVDGGGPGAGVIDRLRMLRYPVQEVQFGSAPTQTAVSEHEKLIYANKRAEMWGKMRAWLKQGGAVPDDPELEADLTGVEYGYVLRDGLDAILLEKKEDMKKRGLASPDKADALACTFAFPVARSDHRHAMSRGPVHQSNYDPMGREHIRSDYAGGGGHQYDYDPLRR